MSACGAQCPACRGRGYVWRLATETFGREVVRSWHYQAECPARYGREMWLASDKVLIDDRRKP